ncbi:MAG TPA: methyltransferase domain-containing protein [Gemmatimonadota bacterium]|nr:methyltransferase domain-containing protein [Gemmatimonadota bacterium]
MAGITRAWQGDTIPRGPAGGEPAQGDSAQGDPARGDSARSRHRPRLDRVTRLHGWWYPPRVLEPEVMDGGEEAAAYIGSAAQAHLARLDAGWAERILAAGPRGPARVLDVGTGGAQIPALLAGRRPEWRIWAVDRSGAMLREGQGDLSRKAAAARLRARPFRLSLAEADARQLPFAEDAFDLVVSNSLLHHLADPTAVLDEIARVVRPGGRVLLRDLRRPPRLTFDPHVAWHGRHYGGVMRRLYEASVAAAFTPAEIEIILRHTGLAGTVVHAEGPYLVVQAGPRFRGSAMVR